MQRLHRCVYSCRLILLCWNPVYCLFNVFCACSLSWVRSDCKHGRAYSSSVNHRLCCCFSDIIVQIALKNMQTLPQMRDWAQSEHWWSDDAGQMKVESSALLSWALRARASNSCLIRADFSCSSWVMRSLFSVTSCKWERKIHQGPSEFYFIPWEN